MSKSKKLLTLDDLYSFYSKNKNFSHFDDKENPIVVQTNGKLKFEEYDNTEGLFPVVLQTNHTGVNLNKSRIDDDVQLKALDSIYNRPILGYIHEVDGQWEFYSHNMHLDDNDEIVYDEIPIGVIPESGGAELVYDEEKGKKYVNVKGYIFSEYTKAQEILEREKECSVSVELAIRELSFDAKEKVLNIEDFYYNGITILGRTPEGEKVDPGMSGSNVKLADFSKENNSLFSNAEANQKLIETLDKLNTTLSECFNKEENQKGGTEVNKFEELLEKYSKTVEDIGFDYESMTDEELEVKFAELFEGEDAGSEDTSTDESEDNAEEDGSEDSDSNEDDEGLEEPTEETSTFGKTVTDLENGNKQVSFEISHEDIRYALYNLISQFEELDNVWYYIESVYDDYFVFSSWDDNNIFGCKYVKDEDNVSLDGERYRLYKELLTESEKAELDSMRSNYALIQEQLNKYVKAEEDAQKEAIFADETYAEYLDSEEFKSLMENKDNYSVEELKDKAEIAFAKCVRKNGTFSAKNKTPYSGRMTLFSAEKDEEKNPYPTLFA